MGAAASIDNDDIPTDFAAQLRQEAAKPLDTSDLSDESLLRDEVRRLRELTQILCNISTGSRRDASLPDALAALLSNDHGRAIASVEAKASAISSSAITVASPSSFTSTEPIHTGITAAGKRDRLSLAKQLLLCERGVRRESCLREISQESIDALRNVCGVLSSDELSASNDVDVRGRGYSDQVNIGGRVYFLLMKDGEGESVCVAKFGAIDGEIKSEALANVLAARLGVTLPSVALLRDSERQPVETGADETAVEGPRDTPDRFSVTSVIGCGFGVLRQSLFALLLKNDHHDDVVKSLLEDLDRCKCVLLQVCKLKQNII